MEGSRPPKHSLTRSLGGHADAFITKFDVVYWTTRVWTAYRPDLDIVPSFYLEFCHFVAKTWLVFHFFLSLLLL